MKSYNEVTIAEGRRNSLLKDEPLIAYPVPCKKS